MDIITIETPSLGDRSYVLIDDGEAAVIDPQRDIDRIDEILDDRQATLRFVLETHVHNDYVSGGKALSQQHSADYVLPAEADVAFEHRSAGDGTEFRVGGTTLRAVHTPGHTPNHLSYVATDDTGRSAVFTGGSMLFGTVGRTDLIGEDETDDLTRAQFRSVHRLVDELADDTEVLPTHGFGSFCSSADASDDDESTIGKEKSKNIAATSDDEDAFVEELLSGLTAHPRYYAHMAPMNEAGATPVDLSPPSQLDATAIRRHIHAGDWVVDLRSRKAFADGHLSGSVNIEIGTSFVTYLGWTIPWGTPVVLVGDTADEVAEAQRQLVRIGIDRPAGAADGGLGTWADGGDVRTYRSVSFDELAGEIEAGDGLTVLDVRRDDERSDGHVADSLHIPLHELVDRVDELPDGPIWVHCASGYRAAIAASLIDRTGREVVAIDDDWETAAEHPDLQTTSG